MLWRLGDTWEIMRRAADPLSLLIAAQTLFLVVGISILDFNVAWTDVLIAVVSACIVEWILAGATSYRTGSTFSLFLPRSAIAAALGIGIFFRASEPWYFALAASIAISSKYIVRLHGRHIFNPSNLAIVSLVFLIPAATTIEFTQWGNNLFVYAGVACISLAVAYRAGVFPITVSFLSSYGVLLLAFVHVAPQIFAPHHYGLLGPSLIMFASFMITDPKTAPRGVSAGILHGVSVAAAYFTLETLGIQYALFVASFLIAGLGALSRLLHIESVKSLISNNDRFLALPNAVTTAALIVSCTGAYAFLRVETGTFDPRPLSTQFLLMGVESEGLRACSPIATFREVPTRLTHGVNTTGAAWGDFDTDGYHDLLVTYLDAPSVLLHNRAGTIDPEPALLLPAASSGFFVDYDNDSDLDILLFGTPRTNGASSLASRGVTVYENRDGVFSEATRKIGLSGLTLSEHAGTTATFSDLDANGSLDMVVAENSSRFELFTQTREAFQKMLANPAIRQSSLATCAPEDVRAFIEGHENLRKSIIDRMPLEDFYASGACLILQGTIALADAEAAGDTTLWNRKADVVDAVALIPGSVRAFRNIGGVYTEVPSVRALVDSIQRESAEQSSVFAIPGKHPYGYISGSYFQPVTFDYDSDGRIDIFIAIDYGSNLLLKNAGGWIFKDATADAGLDYYSNGMGADVSDIDHDGLLDLVVTNTLEDYVFRNTGSSFENTTLFTDFARTGLGWGVSFLDYDLDGGEDVFIANGDSVRNNDAPDGALSRPLFRADNLYRNLGNGTYASVDGTDLCADAQSGRALAVADYDADGDPDVFVGNRQWQSIRKPENALLANRTLPGSPHYLTVRLRGSYDNVYGIGAVVTVETEAGSQTKTLLAGNSFRSQNASEVLFGLGDNESTVRVSVVWPSGRKTVVETTKIDRILVIEQ